MKKFHVLVLVVVGAVGTSRALDWYALTQANYAAIQSGLAQLNEAARQINQSITTQEKRCIAALNDLDDFAQKTIRSLMYQYPQYNISLELTNNALQSIPNASSIVEVSDMAEYFRQKIVFDVMVSAQSIIRSILNATNIVYGHQSKRCSQQYAARLTQPQLSVGRLRRCIDFAVPYIGDLADTFLGLVNYSKNAGSELLKLFNICSPNSTYCMTIMGFEIGFSVHRINDLYLTSWGQFGKNLARFIMSVWSTMGDCANIIEDDIKEILHDLVNKTISC
ncbi:uncharacterized protein LOC134221252 [Armigeres subalbatus]|uniref:uncharacterized protein LOC134221252 n=1 Tax=Armigeres subalbatus TaxID=124917 RepID=UPI002ED6A3A1